MNSAKGKTTIIMTTTGLALSIFLIDTFVPLGIAGCMPYVLVVLASLWISYPYAPILTAIACTVLTYLNLAFLPAGSEWAKILVNRSLAVFAIWATAILGVILKREKEQARQGNESFQLAMEATNEGFWDWDLQTNHFTFSEAWSRSLGFHPDEIKPHFRSWENLVHPEDMPNVQKQLQAHLEGKTPIYECEHRLKTKSDTWRWNLHRGKVVARDPSDKPIRMAGVDIDITERKQSEQREQLQKTILEKIVIGTHSQPDVLNDLCLQVERILPSCICSVMLLDETTGVLKVGAVPSGGQSACTILEGLVPGEFAGACGTAVHTGKMVIIEDTDNDPRWEPIREAARSLGIKSCWSIPIFTEDRKVLGTFAISHPQYRRPTTHDFQLLETASYLASIAIKRTSDLRTLQDSEERFRDLYESAPIAYFTSQMDGRIKSGNSRAVQLLGYSQEELKNRTVVDLYAPGKNGREKAQRLHKQIQEGKEIEGEELEMQRADGSHLWVSLTVRLIRNANGIPIERRGIVEDITARKEAEEELRLTKFVIDHAGDTILWAGPDKRIVYANKAANRFSDYSPKELIGKPLPDIFLSQDPHHFSRKLENLRHTSTIQYEAHHRTKQDKEFPVELTLSSLVHNDAPYTCAIVRDITDRKRAEELLERQKSILEMISTKMALPHVLTQICKVVENQSDHMYCSIHLLEGTVLRNGAAPSLPETYIQKLDKIPIGPSAGSCGTAAYRKEPVIVSDIATDPLWERGRRLALGHELRACWSTPILSSSGSVLGTFAMYYSFPRTPGSEDFKLIDIATSLAGIAIEQSRAEEALLKSEDRYRTLYEDNPTMYFTVSTEGTVLSVNQFGANQLGYQSEDLIGKPVASIFHEEDQPEFLAQFEKSLQDPKQLSSWEFRKIRTDGSLLWVKETTRVIEGPTGDPVVLIVCEDITDRKRSEQLQKLQQSALELLITESSLSDILNALCGQVEVMVPSAICSILTLDEKAQSLRFQAGPSVPPTLAAVLDGMKPGPCEGSCGTATFRKEPVYVSNTATDPLWAHMQDTAKQFRIAACWSYPIYAEGKQVIGSFAISFPHPYSPTAADIHILETASYLAGIAIRRRETEQALAESEQRYRTLYEDNPSMYFTVSLDGKVLSVNQFGANQLGYSVEELLGKPVFLLFVEEDRVAVKKELDKCLENPMDLSHWQFRKIRKDGKIIWVRETARIIRDEDNQIVFLVVCNDITEQKQADERIAENERTIRELYEITSSPDRSFEHRVRSLLALGCRRFKLPIGMLTHRINEDELELQFVHTPDPVFKEGTRIPLDNTFCSTAMVADTPISFEHASRSEWQQHPGYSELGLESYLGTKVLTGQETYGTFCFTSTEPHSGIFSDADKDFLQLMARWIGTELERLNAEMELRKNHTLMKVVLEGTSDAFFVKDLEGRYLMMNVSGRRLVSKAEQDIIGHTDEDIFPSDTAATIKAQDEKILQCGITRTFEEELVSNGIKRTFLTTKGPYRDTDGHTVGLFGNARDITQRKQAEAKLQEINIALSNAMPGISQVNPDGCYTEVNDSYAHMVGYHSEELIGTSWELTVHADDIPSAKAAYQEMLQSGKGEFEAKAFRKDGSTFYQHVLMVKRVNDQGDFLGNHCFMRDITERRQAEETLRRIIEATSPLISTDFFRSLLRHLAAALQVKYAFITECTDSTNTRVKTLAFLKGETFVENVTYELIGTPCEHVIQGTFCCYPENIQTLFPFDQDLVALNAQSYIGLPLLDSSGNIIGHIAVLNEFSMALTTQAESLLKIFAGRAGAELERHRAEGALRLTQFAVDHAEDAICWFGPCEQLLYANESASRLLGYSPEELRSMTFTDLSAYHDPNLHQQQLMQLHTNGSIHYETTLKKKSDKVFPVDVSLNVLKHPDQEYICAIMRDVTERKHAEKMQQRLVTILETTTDFVGMADNEGRTLYLNPAGKAIMGFPDKHNALGAPIHTYHPSWARDLLMNESLPQAITTGVWTGDTALLHRDGHEIPVSQVLFTQKDKQGNIDYFMTIIRNISERKHAEAQLREAYEQTRELSARLEAAEESERKRIARELHDEFGQMLTGLKFDLSWVQRRLSEQPNLTPYNTILSKTRSMLKLTDELIQTVRRIATSLRPSILDDLGLIPALEWQAKDFQNRTGIQCQFTTGSGIINVSIDNDRATALFRIAQELCTNVLRYANATKVNLDLRNENHVVVLVVQDNGRGISEQEIRHPIALGLLGIKERIAPFNGKFLIEGTAGKGTCAMVSIPLP